MQSAQEYLAKVLPWPQDGDAPAYINIHWSSVSLNPKGKPWWSGRATRSVKEAVNTVKWALTLDDVKDIYVLHILAKRGTREDIKSRQSVF